MRSSDKRRGARSADVSRPRTQAGLKRKEKMMGTTGTDAQLLLTVREVAELLHLGERTIWKLSTTGELPSPIRIGRSRRWDRRDVEAWLAEDRAGHAEAS